MEDERITRALNLLGENSDLFSADHDGLLDLIEDYFDYHTIEGKFQLTLLSNPAYCPTQQLVDTDTNIRFSISQVQ